MVRCFKRNSLWAIPFFLSSPTDEFNAISLIITQRFSVGHFWSPFHATNEVIFYNLFINTEKSTIYKYSVSISCEILHFHAIRYFFPRYTTIQQPRLWVQKRRKLKNSLRFLYPFVNVAPTYVAASLGWGNQYA